MTNSTIDVRTSQQGIVTVTINDDAGNFNGLEGSGFSLQEALEDLAYNLDEIAETA